MTFLNKFKKFFLKDLGVFLIIILISILLRIFPHPPNVAPLGALSLLGGVYLSKKYAIVLPLLVMIPSDIVIGFHATTFYVYVSLLLAVLIGIWVKQAISYKMVVMASLGSSILFFIITNFGVFIATPLYSKTLEGFFECYYYALPFFRNSILGDLFYSTSFYYGLHLSRKILEIPLVVNVNKSNK